MLPERAGPRRRTSGVGIRHTDAFPICRPDLTHAFAGRRLSDLGGDPVPDNLTAISPGPQPFLLRVPPHLAGCGPGALLSCRLHAGP